MSKALLTFDLVTKPPTHCSAPLLWSPGDAEFTGQADDSEHLAVSLQPAHQNKHEGPRWPSQYGPRPALSGSQHREDAVPKPKRC